MAIIRNLVSRVNELLILFYIFLYIYIRYFSFLGLIN